LLEFGKIETLAMDIVLCHSLDSCFSAAWGCGTERDDGAKKSRHNIATS